MAKRENNFPGFNFLFFVVVAFVGIVAIAVLLPFQGNFLGQRSENKPVLESEARGPLKAFTATLTLSPNPAMAGGQTFTGSGSGYYPSSFAYINIQTPNSLYATSVATDASGNMTFTHPTAEAGTYTIKVFQYKPKGNKLTQVAGATLEVVQLTSP